MKKIIFILLLMNGLFVYSQSIVKDVYNFPIKQGSKEWTEIESVEKRIAALQMPGAVLSDISTEGLLETCLEFPYLTDVLFCDNYQRGFEALVSEFNGYSELFKRPDLISVLLKKYKMLSSDITNLRSKSNVEQGRFTFRYFVFELMLAQDIVCEKLNSEQEKQLFSLSIEHKNIKHNHLDIFGNLNFLPANLLYAKKVMTDSNFTFKSVKQKNAISDFVKAPMSIDQLIVDEMENHIILTIKKN